MANRGLFMVGEVEENPKRIRKKKKKEKAPPMTKPEIGEMAIRKNLKGKRQLQIYGRGS